MFPYLFGVNASALTNKFENLEFVLPELSHYIRNKITLELTQQSITKALDNYFMKYLSKNTFHFDPRLLGALEIIMRNNGNIHLEKELDTGISPRQLRRMFEYYLGDTPKVFSKVVRFQQILRAKPSVQSLKENKIFYDVGYYDQAHFIKDFKNFYGVTPNKAFRNLNSIS